MVCLLVWLHRSVVVDCRSVQDIDRREVRCLGDWVRAMVGSGEDFGHFMQRREC